MFYREVVEASRDYKGALRVLRQVVVASEEEYLIVNGGSNRSGPTTYKGTPWEAVGW